MSKLNPLHSTSTESSHQAEHENIGFVMNHAPLSQICSHKQLIFHPYLKYTKIFSPTQFKNHN